MHVSKLSLSNFSDIYEISTDFIGIIHWNPHYSICQCLMFNVVYFPDCVLLFCSKACASTRTCRRRFGWSLRRATQRLANRNSSHPLPQLRTPPSCTHWPDVSNTTHYHTFLVHPFISHNTYDSTTFYSFSLTCREVAVIVGPENRWLEVLRTLLLVWGKGFKF